MPSVAAQDGPHSGATGRPNGYRAAGAPAGALGDHDPLGAVKVQARRFPRQIQEFDQPPALARQVAHQQFVTDLKCAQRQYTAPSTNRRSTWHGSDGGGLRIVEYGLPPANS